jgi:AcrR family transcriptional regulator
MSRVRVRPTREETSDRIFSAAIEVFQDVGIAGASVEDIVVAAGLTRGAFYSSFANKDELVVALLEHHVAQAVKRNQLLADRYADPVAFVEAIASDEERDDLSMGRIPLLNFELRLYAARNPAHRPAISKLLQTLRLTIGTIAMTTLRAAGVTRDIDVIQTGAMLLALEDGFDLHRLIDPEQTPPNSYYLALGQLQDLVLDAPRDASRKPVASTTKAPQSSKQPRKSAKATKPK